MSEKPDDYSAHLSALLTGQRHRVREPTQWHERILEGLPVAAMETVKARAALTDAELARLLGVGEATLRRARVSGAALDPGTSDRLFRLSRVIAVALEVLGNGQNAMNWLRRSQPGLGGEVPLDRLATHAGADEVETLLRRIDYGVYT